MVYLEDILLIMISLSDYFIYADNQQIPHLHFTATSAVNTQRNFRPRRLLAWESNIYQVNIFQRKNTTLWMPYYIDISDATCLRLIRAVYFNCNVEYDSMFSINLGSDRNGS